MTSFVTRVEADRSALLGAYYSDTEFANAVRCRVCHKEVLTANRASHIYVVHGLRVEVQLQVRCAWHPSCGCVAAYDARMSARPSEGVQA